MAPNGINIIVWSMVSFICGSLPFSVWIGRILGRDVRSEGDRNPGAVNAYKATGWKGGIMALFLDISKAAGPTGLACQLWNWRGWEIVPVAWAVLIGSAFSPFLGFKGGKSLSVSLGIWIGLTIWKAPAVILVSLTVAYLIQSISGWAVIVSLCALISYLVLSQADAVYLIIVFGQAILLVWKHRSDLNQRPRVRKWLAKK